jgi:superfamily II DNA or RNA helicase
VIRAEPYVVMRLKRLFSRVDKGEHGEVVLADTPEVCRELLWFTERYPMDVKPLAQMMRGAEKQVERERIIADVQSGSYKPPKFELALPPREYQRTAADLWLRSGALLLGDDLGLGKTVSAIAGLTDPRTLPAVVVTLTHLPRQWQAMLGKFAPNLRSHICARGAPIDLRARYSGRLPDVVILNYAKLSGWADYLGPLAKSVIFDEVQELRTGPGSDKYSAAAFIAESATFRLGLTATPVYNYGGEMYHVLNALSPDTLGTYEEFCREWCRGEGSKTSVIDPRTFGVFLRDQGLMLRRTRADVGRELPALTRVPHQIDADAREIDKVKDAAAELARIILAQGEAQRGDKMRAAEELSWRLRQATGIAKAPFVAEFVRILVEGGEKVVLYGWHREVYAIWMARLAQFKPVLYTGSESPAQKHAALEQFMKGETSVLIMSLRSGAGVDGLQHHARTVVFGELDWSPGVHDQCIGRLHRDAQAEPVVAYFLIADSGSDPIVADVLGLKREQGELIRDPKLDLVSYGGHDSAGHMRRLAEQFLKARSAA